MDLAHPLVQQQSVRGILGACGWLFVAQWHFLSSHEAWFSMTRIASQEHWGHKQTARGTHHHFFKSCHMSSNITKTSSQTSPSSLFFYVSYLETPLASKFWCCSSKTVFWAFMTEIFGVRRFYQKWYRFTYSIFPHHYHPFSQYWLDNFFRVDRP